MLRVPFQLLDRSIDLGRCDDAGRVLVWFGLVRFLLFVTYLFIRISSGFDLVVAPPIVVFIIQRVLLINLLPRPRLLRCVSFMVELSFHLG